MSKALNIAKGGLFTALTIIFLYLSSMLPTSRLFLIALAACIIPLSIITTNINNTIIVYVASSILSLLLGLRGSALVYIVFFGLYGFVKYYVERLRKAPLEFVLKFIFFNLCIITMYLMYKLFSLGIPKLNIPIYYGIVAFEIVFVIYDYALTVVISYMNKRIKRF
jgi:hypothetical protein